MRRQRRGARSRDLLALGALSIAMGVTACEQSASARATDAAERATREAVVRQTETVQRVTIPKDSGRVLYDAPTDLSLVNAIRTKATIVRLDSGELQRSSPPHRGVAGEAGGGDTGSASARERRPQHGVESAPR